MLQEQDRLNLINEFENLVNSIALENADKDGLLKYLRDDGFYTSPASTQYNCSFEGGLLLHCLNVYYTLDNLVKTFAPGMYSDDSIKIVGLLHCLYKCNFYESYIMNKKVYSANGSKSDSMGRFDWVSEKSYKVKDASERFVCADNATNSYIMLSRFIPLDKDEISAIVNQDCNVNNGQSMPELPTILSNCSLTTLLHCAIMISTYIMEREDSAK